MHDDHAPNPFHPRPPRSLRGGAGCHRGCRGRLGRRRPAGAGAQPRTASFRKVGDGPLQDLGDLDGGATFCSVVTVSDDGHVIVGSASSRLSGENFLEAFRKIDDGPLEPLGDLDGGPFGSDALDVSADGRVIVGCSVVNDDESEEAFIFTDQDGLRRLAEVAVDASSSTIPSPFPRRPRCLAMALSWWATP